MINRSIQSVLSLDEHEMLDRQCPKQECGGFFKADFAFLEKWESEECFCPYCRHLSDASEFRTPEQTVYLNDEGAQVVAEELEGLLRDAFKGNKSVKMSGTGATSDRPIPPTAKPVAELEFVCDQCGGKTGLDGVGMFCHFCGENQAAHTALQQLANITRKLQNAATRDSVSAQSRSETIESAFKDSVEILERVGKDLYLRLPKAESTFRRGTFQRFEDADALWLAANGSDLKSLYSSTDSANFEIYVATRHVYVHNSGVVDQDYLNKSGDTSYQLGDRVVPTVADAQEFVRLARIRCMQMILDTSMSPSIDQSIQPGEIRGTPRPSGFTEAQWAVFDAACAAAEKDDHANLHRDQVISELPDMDTGDIGEALDLLESVGFVSLQGTLDSHPVPLHIAVTMRGLNHYLTHTVPNFENVRRRIAIAALDGSSSAQAITDSTGISRLIVDQVLRDFESRGWIADIFWSGGNGTVHVPKRAFLKQFVGETE